MKPHAETILSLIARHDAYSYLFWHEDLKFFINCNDFFCWGTADCQPILEADLPMFEQAMSDGGDDGPLLYCARNAKMRPQGAYYEFLDKKNWHLFDACGPEREVGLGNPKPHP